MKVVAAMEEMKVEDKYAENTCRIKIKIVVIKGDN